LKISRRLPAWAIVLLSTCAIAQQPDGDWIVALAERFDHLQNPVTVIYAKASLGALVCSEHKAAGAKLLRDGWAQLQSLPDDALRPPHSQEFSQDKFLPYPLLNHYGGANPPASDAISGM